MDMQKNWMTQIPKPMVMTKCMPVNPLAQELLINFCTPCI
jgi:hypothetical protein